MLKQVEGSQAVAEAIALCRPQVICAYPISPQTHIVEALGQRVDAGSLAPCEFVNVESEFAAMSVAIGASATGARAYTATASQGLLFMAEAVYNAAGLGLPIVMTVANRAIGAPINIWNDHTDALSQRDCGWLQLFAEDNQEALDLHIQAFRLAEELSLPVMVCMDGFILTHAYERVDMPTQAQVDAYLPPYRAAPGARSGRSGLDRRDGRARGVHGGALPGTRQAAAGAGTDPAWADEFRRVFGRPSGGLVHEYRTEDADVIVVALGSVLGTIKDTVDAMREQGRRIGVLGITCFRPWPSAAVCAALAHAQRVVVLEKSLAVGMGGIVANNVSAAFAGSPDRVHAVIAGLGGRSITRSSLQGVFERALAGTLEPLTFLDLDHALVDRVLERERSQRRSGPIAEGILKDIGVVAAKTG